MKGYKLAVAILAILALFGLSLAQALELRSQRAAERAELRSQRAAERAELESRRRYMDSLPSAVAPDGTVCGIVCRRPDGGTFLWENR